MNVARCLLPVAAVLLWLAASAAPAQSVSELEKQVQDNPSAVKPKEALAEAYLKDCQLEKSLKLWQQILAAQPDHARAKLVVGRLTAQALDLDTQLETLGTLIDKGVFKGTDALLDAAAQRAATDSQKAHILYLRGRLALGDAVRPAQVFVPAAAPAEAEAAEPEGEDGSDDATQPAEAKKPRRAPRAAAKPTPVPRAQVIVDEPRADAAQEAAARVCFEGAMKVAPDSPWAARAAMALARLDAQAGNRDAAIRLLRQAAENKNLADEAVKQLAKFRLVLLESQGLTQAERIAAIKELLSTTTAGPARRAVLEELVAMTTVASGRWGPEAVDYLGLMLKVSPGYEEAAAVLARLAEVAAASQDGSTLDRLVAVLKDIKSDDPAVVRQGQFVLVEAMLARAVAADKVVVVKALAADAHKLLDSLGGEKAQFSDRARAGELRGRCFLVAAQKLIALEGPTQGMPLLVKAKDHYLAMLPTTPEQCLDRLANIASLLEHVKEWEMAVALYREVATNFPHLPQGRDALLNVARLYEKPLNNPMAALAAYAEYSSRYPAELAYRQLEVGKRLARLGYANVLDFQKRNNLNPDGLMGPVTAARLEEVERTFDQISATRGDDGGILRGRFVHPQIFAIARRLESAGRARDAIAAYRMFVNLYPTKAGANEALLSVARLLRDNLLFEEALGAYAETIEDFPKGGMTSEAYVESASCLENLGRWKEAREFYDLYTKKFPKYKHVALCKERIAILDDLRQYQDFVAGDPRNPKAAEAQYQIATILYEKLKNNTKAAVEFQKVAENFPKHVRAADGLYTAGAALLKVENFPAARKAFEQVVKDYHDSRLADDSQFWIGHTYEYAARALGKLDDHRIVLKRRSLAEQASLAADLEFRRTYWPKAAAAPQVPEDIWGGDALGVLTSGSTRDRVNADLFRAIDAYRKVVDEFKTGDMAGNALLRIGTIYIQYLKDPDKGINAYQELLAHYGATKEAVDALYEVGAHYLKNANYDEAIKSYQQFIYNYPKDERVEDAMLAVARCQVEKKAWDKALDAYQSYLAKFPSGKSAEFAKAQVAWIRMYHF
ncbi:MAG: tetratricopeptide repeat protein [Phycisphaerae bacterium]